MDGCCCSSSLPEERFQAVLLRAGTSVYSPWVPRGGDYLRATADLVARHGISLMVQLFTRNLSELGDGVEVDAATTITLPQPGRQTKEWNPATGVGLRELIRYKFTAGSGLLTGWVVFRMLSPVWFDAVAVIPPL
jgi:hypothetical protein